MLIDWLSLRLPTDNLSPDMLRAYQAQQDRVLRISGSGELQWEVSAWDSIKSDSHQIALQVSGDHVRIQGSPARILGDGDNVFSCGAAAALDLVGCHQRMVSFVNQQTGLDLPSTPSSWSLSRVDVTQNLYLGSLPAVRQALAILRDCEGGRYRVSQQAGDTVYWSHRSRLRSGKAYAKGAEIMQKAVKQGKSKIPQPSAREYTLDEIALASGLLRLELKLGAQYWRERILCEWHEVTPDLLETEWRNYFQRMIGGAEIMNEQDIYKRLLDVVDTDKQGKPKETQAKAAYAMWCLIKSEGWQKARDFTSKTTWYRNLKHLRNAGLSDADISKGQVVQLRQKVLEAVPVNSWGELHQLKAA